MGSTILLLKLSGRKAIKSPFSRYIHRSVKTGPISENMYYRLSVVILFCWLTGLMLNGQPLKSFTHEPDAFFGELNGMFQSIQVRDNQQKAISTLSTFSGLWNAGSFSPEQQQTIYQTADLMLLRKLRSFPDFEQYLQTLTTFKSKNIGNDNFDIWLTATLQMLESKGNAKAFVELLGFTGDFIESGILYQSRILTWSAGNSQFRFGYDSIFYARFDQCNITCFTKSDTSVIYETRGYYFPLNQHWKGEGGKVTWQRANLPENEVFAQLNDYEIDMKSASFEANPVAFNHNKYFRGALVGALIERVSTNAVSPDNALYPRFESEVRNLMITSLFRDVDYEGSFSMRGAKIYGSGDVRTPAKITFKRPYRDKTGNYDLLTARSNEFIISPDRITAETAAITITHQDDSIVHTGLQFRYLDQNREISLLRINQGIEQSPYSNSFHDIEMESEAIFWKMDEEVIRMGAMYGLKNQSTATFTSNKFFSEQQFDNLMGIDRKHPLLWLHDYSKEFNTKEFFIDQMATYMKIPQSQVEAQVIRLATMGFLQYDIGRKHAVITDKVNHYLFSKSKLNDYDVISFLSNVDDRINAELKLENFDLSLRGVPQVSISNAKKVSIRPAGQEVTLRKNRDFIFSGSVQAGLFDFKATECYFNYDTFKLNMPTVDTMRFKVQSFDMDQFGKHRLVDVKTPITGISGEMLIDRPGNKSGLVESPRYPIFTSTTESYVFYDDTAKLKEAYNRELFYYYLKPFTLESLENFATESIKFEGYLNSGSIFPDEIDEPMVVMPDYSLGFQRKIPEAGYSVYKGKGTYYDTITLSKAGLRGNGRLEYLNSVSKSQQFIFYLDSANASKVEFDLKSNATSVGAFPPVKGFNLNQHWIPYKDSMLLNTTDSPIALFNERALLSGSLTLTPTLLSGAGELDFLNATAHSNHYEFTANAFSSDTTKLVLRDIDVSNVIFNTENYRAYVDLDQKTGNFKTNDIFSKIDLPVIRYVSFLNEFDWYFDRNEVELYSYVKPDLPGLDTLTMAELIGKPLPGAQFISVHPMQDSLSFYSPRANYNITGNILTARDVQLINVADAAIFPRDGLVEIHKNGVIQPLIGATIIADTSNQNHIITDAEVIIQSGIDYKARGKYAFTNAIGEVHTVNFDEITVDKGFQTIASGKVTEDDHFQLSPRFAFKGEVTLNARDPLLDFKGGYMVVQDCDSSLSRWVDFQQRISPEELIMPVPEQLLEQGYKQLYAGIFHSNEENRVYPAFLSRRSYYSDSLLFSMNGLLKTRKKGAELLIVKADQADLGEDSEPSAPFMRWNIDNCTINARGKLSFGQDLGQVKMDVFGQINHSIFQDSTFFDVTISVDFYFPEEALVKMAEDLGAANKPAIDMNDPMIRESFEVMIGKDESDQVFADLNLFGTIKRMPEGLKKNFIFTDVKMTYDIDSRSFISKGTIGVLIIKGNPVYKNFDGYLQVVRRRSGDEFNVYLELERGHWYFFTYKGNLMQAASSRTDFNAILRDIKTEKRQDEQGKGEPAYRFTVSDTQTKNRFLRNMQQEATDDE
ncbi:MAG: hypothetical protein IH598_14720 [Bacteroidales bacterium]|nr:hypothetical protein [Bacteroidales bacterium]